MKNLLATLWMASMACMVSGCTICCSPYDYDYLSTGTRIQRTDMVHGRVGSTFSDPNFQTASYVEESPSDIIYEGSTEEVPEAMEP